MTSRTAYRTSLAFGVLVLALTAFSIAQPPMIVCGGLSKNYTPIIAFELVRSLTDLHAIFGDAPGACRTAIAARMDYINRIDSFAFIQIYGAFLLFFFLASWKQALGRLGAVLVIAACLADHAENYALFHLSAAPDAPANWLNWLMWATETKWVGLGIANAIGGILLARAYGVVGVVAALLCFVGTAVSVASVPEPTLAGPYLSNAIALGWLMFFIADVREAVRVNRAAT